MPGIPDDVRALLEGRNFGHLATVLPDGAPHSVAIWVGTEGDRVVFFTQPTSRKARNLAGDPRVALSVVDRANPYSTGWVRGRVVEAHGRGGAAADRRALRPLHGAAVPDALGDGVPRGGRAGGDDDAAVRGPGSVGRARRAVAGPRRVACAGG